MSDEPTRKKRTADRQLTKDDECDSGPDGEGKLTGEMPTADAETMARRRVVKVRRRAVGAGGPATANPFASVVAAAPTNANPFASTPASKPNPFAATFNAVAPKLDEKVETSKETDEKKETPIEKEATKPHDDKAAGDKEN